MAPPSINFKSGPAQSQLFSFPPDVISHLWQHPTTPQVLKKLYRTCKYFFSKKQILILPYTDLIKHGWGINGQNQKTSVECYKKEKFNNENCWLNSFLAIELPKWENLKLQKQIWLCNKLCLYNLEEFKLDEKIYRCSIHTLILSNANISFQDFCILTSEKTIINFTMRFRSRIFNSWNWKENGTKISDDKVQIDIIISKLPNLKNFQIWIFENEDKFDESFQKLSSIKLETQLKHFQIWFSFGAAIFDITFLCKFLHRNVSKDCSIKFYGTSGHEGGVLKAALKNLDSDLKKELPKIKLQ